MNKEVEKIAELAASWWCKQLQYPNFDNGDESKEGQFASILAKHNTKEITGTQLQGFKEELKNFIISELEKPDPYEENSYFYENRDITTLSTDYGPSLYLSKISNKYNIPDSNYPWKTTMWLSRNHLKVRGGYTAESKMLYATEKYYKTKIQEYKKEIKDVEEYDNDKWNRIHSISKQDLINDYKSILDDLYKQLTLAYPVPKNLLKTTTQEIDKEVEEELINKVNTTFKISFPTKLKVKKELYQKLQTSPFLLHYKDNKYSPTYNKIPIEIDDSIKTDYKFIYEGDEQ